MIIKYSTNMKLFLIKSIYTFLSFVVIIFFTSCSILDYEEKNNRKLNKKDVKMNKCPSTKIPSQTANYISSKKYILSIKKIQMACKSKIVRSSDALDTVVQFNVKMELKTNNKVKTKDLKLPSIFIALVDKENEAVLIKMVSSVDISNKEGSIIVNKKKFRFKHANNDNLSIYFGLQ